LLWREEYVGRYFRNIIRYDIIVLDVHVPIEDKSDENGDNFRAVRTCFWAI